MIKSLKNPFNVNSLLTCGLGVLLTFALRKVDDTNTRLIEGNSKLVTLTEKVTALDRKMADMVLKSDFTSEIARLDRELGTLRAEVYDNQPQHQAPAGRRGER